MPRDTDAFSGDVRTAQGFPRVPQSETRRSRTPLAGSAAKQQHRRVLVRTFGRPPDVARIACATSEDPGRGRVRVLMRAAAVNPSDCVTIAGAYPSRTELPFVPGFEGLGIVDAVGPDVENLRPGDRVLAIGSAGAWQEKKSADAAWCFRLPEKLSDEAAATSYVNPLTALLMLRDRIGAGPGMRIAIDAAGSAVGRMLLRLASRLGASPVAIVRDEQSLRLLDGHGVERAIVLPDEDGPGAVARAVRCRLGPAPLHAALDAVGGAVGEALHASLAPGGRFIHYGLLSGRPLPPDLPRRRPDVSFELFWLRQWVHAQPKTVLAARLAEAWALVEAGVLASEIEACYPLVHVREALRHALRQGRAGKILLSMS